MSIQQRQLLIDLLQFPRSYIANDVRPEYCQYNLEYYRYEQTCKQCKYGVPCEWICSVNEFAPLSQYSIQHLQKTVQFALEYVFAGVLGQNHEPRHCACSACRWIRQSEQTMLDLDDTN